MTSLSKSADVSVTYSYNWSGYAQLGSKGLYTSVTDTWTVPRLVAGGPNPAYSADWVGIGGFALSDKTLVQAGTEVDDVNGSAEVYAWTEVLPAAEKVLTLAVHQGDSITTTVEKITASGDWLMEVHDDTTDQSEYTLSDKRSSGRSVEAVHEATSVGHSIGPLAKTTDVTFAPGTFTSSESSGDQPLLSPAVETTKLKRHDTVERTATVYEMIMESQSTGAVEATPSPPDVDGQGFTVAYGSTAPPSPAS